MNYFNYFTEIEDTFIRRRGKHLLLSPMDWALIEAWKEKGIPLHIALNGIEKAFDSYHSRPRHRSVKTLFYCEEEVEAQFADWLESRLGSDGNSSNTESILVAEPENNLPSPRADILDFLTRIHDELTHAQERCIKSGLGSLSEVLSRTILRLQEINADFTSALHPNAEKLEFSLNQLEELLDSALLESITSTELETIRSEVGKQLRSYKNRMDTSTYEQTLSNLLSKNLRERFGIPRLSLFYI